MSKQEKLLKIINPEMEIPTADITDITAVPLDEKIQNTREEKVTKYKSLWVWCEAELQVRKAWVMPSVILAKQLFLKALKGSSDHVSDLIKLIN